MPINDRQQRRPRFQYQERSVDDMKERIERRNSRYDSIFKGGFQTWKPAQGYNNIRFLPPTWDNARHYGFTIWQHGFIGPDQGSYLCIQKMQGKPCPICNEARRAQAAGDDDERYKHQASERVLTWILDREGEDPTKPLLFHMSKTQDTDILSLCYNHKTKAPLWIDNPDVGFDVSFQRTGTTKTNTKYTGYLISRDASPLSEDPRVQQQILDRIEDNPLDTVLQYYPGDYLAKALMGTTGVVQEDDDEAGEALLAAPRRREPDPYEEEDAGTVEAEDTPPWDDEEPPVRPSPQRRATLRTR